MELYAEYVRERLDHEIIEDESGFIEFRINEDKTCFVQDIYVRPKYRKLGSGRAKKLADQVRDLAKERGCNTLTANVDILTKGHNEALLFHLRYGMRVQRLCGSLIVTAKEI